MCIRSLALSAVFVVVTACSSSSTTQVIGGSGGSGAGGGASTEATGGASSAESTGGTLGTESTGGVASQGGSTSTSLDVSCRNYCSTIQSACVSGSNTQYKSDLSCMKSCLAFAPGTLADASINTLGCRFNRALAAVANPDQNCAAAGPSGGGVCGTNCNAYCAMMLTTCSTVYEDLATCDAACESMTGVAETSYHSPQSGNTLQCRIYHVTFAAEGSPEIHCVHASPTPAAPCADS
jgi:hypothetical protein